MRFSGEAASVALGAEERLSLAVANGIHMRKDPPLDMDYFMTTWLLDSAAKYSHVFNHPEALRNFNEKLSVLQLPEMSHQSFVSTQPDLIIEFIKTDCQGDGIVKPLDLFGGRGVFRLNLNEIKNDRAMELLEEATAKGTELRIIQPFDQKIALGEVRVFTVGGKALSWCLKRPKPGSYLANTAAGASLEPYHPSVDDVLRVEGVAKKLMEKGIYFIGFDLIGGYISETNITSPRLLVAENDGADYYTPWAEWIEAFCQRPPSSC
jgi:glutathione synthase